MAYRQVSPAELEGEELRDWYLRTPDEMEEERALKEQEMREFVGRVARKAADQGDRQVAAARGRPVDWHAAEERARQFFKGVIPQSPRIRFVLTPAW